MALRVVEPIERYPGETTVEQIAFATTLKAGESVSSAAVTVETVYGGVPSLTVSSVTVETGDVVQFELTAGANDSRHILTVEATLNNGQVIAQRIRVDSPALSEL